MHKTMKFKYIAAIIVTAIVTLSFTFISTSKSKTVEPTSSIQNHADHSAPVGGLAAHDAF